MILLNCIGVNELSINSIKTINIKNVELFAYNFRQNKIQVLNEYAFSDFKELIDIEFNNFIPNHRKKVKKSNITELTIMNKRQNFKNKQNLRLKKIEFALSNKKNTHFTIFNLRGVILSFVCALVIIFSVYIYFIVTSYFQIKMDVDLVVNTSKINLNNMKSIFYIREMTLLLTLNNTAGVIYPIDLVKKDNIINILQGLITENINLDITNSIMQHQENTKLIDILEKDKVIFFLDSFANINNSTGIYLETQKEINSGLVTRINTYKQIFDTKNIDDYKEYKKNFFFIYNYLNCIHNTSLNVFDILNDSFNSTLNYYWSLYLILIIVFVIICISFLIGIAYSFSAVEKVRITYLSVFFQIEDNIIRDNLEKCNEFLKIYQVSIIYLYILNIE